MVMIVMIITMVMAMVMTLMTMMAMVMMAMTMTAEYLDVVDWILTDGPIGLLPEQHPAHQTDQKFYNLWGVIFCKCFVTMHLM